MDNIKLLNKNQKRVSKLLALLIFLFIYFLIAIFELTSAYFNGKIEDETIHSKSDRVSAIVKTYDTLRGAADDDLDKIIDDILQDTYVYSDSEVIINNLNVDNIENFILPYGEIQKLNGWKILKTKTTRDEIDFYAIIGWKYKTLSDLVGFTFVLMVILGPIFYGILVFFSNKVIREFYKPLRKTIINLESFASNINHEFKTSLSEIISSLELAPIIGEYKQANTYATESAKRLNSTLDSLGALIHFVDSSYRKEKVNLTGLLDKSIGDYKTLLDKKDIELIKNYSLKDKKIIYIDKAPLILSFQNILKNAIKYSNKGGKIEIDIEKNYFRIKDYGVGIKKENLDKIFDRYFRESYNKTGSGIGLSIIKRVTEIYKWNIEIKSEKDKYTEVTVTF